MPEQIVWDIVIPMTSDYEREHTLCTLDTIDGLLSIVRALSAVNVDGPCDYRIVKRKVVKREPVV